MMQQDVQLLMMGGIFSMEMKQKMRSIRRTILPCQVLGTSSEVQRWSSSTRLGYIACKFDVASVQQPRGQTYSSSGQDSFPHPSSTRRPCLPLLCSMTFCWITWNA